MAPITLDLDDETQARLDAICVEYERTPSQLLGGAVWHLSAIMAQAPAHLRRTVGSEAPRIDALPPDTGGARG